jgi:teichuronic acid biosynthesis glycosyltransferase TuaC
MNVLFVSSGNHKNRISNIVLSQGNSLIDKGISVDYFSISGGGIKSYLKSIKPLKDILKSKNYDVIHAHYSLCGITAFFAKKNEKLIVSFMGSDILGNNINNSFIEKLLRFTSKFFAKFIFNHTICKSKNIHNKLFKNTKSTILPNGVDFNLFIPKNKLECRKELNLSLENKIILFATDPNRIEKNFNLANEAFGKVQLINNKVELITIYNIDQKELVKYYNAADVVLLTSYYEGSPNVIKESLACNKVIISTDVGDVKENFIDVNNCFITDYNSDELADKILTAFSFEESNGRDKIKHLNKEIIAEKIIEIYLNTK